jgi:hypothetical protein
VRLQRGERHSGQRSSQRAAFFALHTPPEAWSDVALRVLNRSDVKILSSHRPVVSVVVLAYHSRFMSAR